MCGVRALNRVHKVQKSIILVLNISVFFEKIYEFEDLFLGKKHFLSLSTNNDNGFIESENVIRIVIMQLWRLNLCA